MKKRQPATTQNTRMERGRNPSKVYIPLRWLDNGQVIPNQNRFEKKPMWTQGTTCVNGHLHWYHGQTVKPVVTKWLWYEFTSYTWNWDRYSPSHHILGIETNIALVWNWYYLKSLPGRYCFKLVIVSGHTQLVGSLVQQDQLQSICTRSLYDRVTTWYLPNTGLDFALQLADYWENGWSSTSIQE
jgi:hypothetical protein